MEGSYTRVDAGVVGCTLRIFFRKSKQIVRPGLIIGTVGGCMHEGENNRDAAMLR